MSELVDLVGLAESTKVPVWFFLSTAVFPLVAPGIVLLIVWLGGHDISKAVFVLDSGALYVYGVSLVGATTSGYYESIRVSTYSPFWLGSCVIYGVIGITAYVLCVLVELENPSNRRDVSDVDNLERIGRNRQRYLSAVLTVWALGLSVYAWVNWA